MILEQHKSDIIILIEEARSKKARYVKCCEIVGISIRTLQRWKKEGLRDKRKNSSKRVVRKLSPENTEEIILVCNEPRFRDMSPHHIVPRLLDEGRYIASPRSFYRVLKAAKMLHHRSNMRIRRKRSKPAERKADRSNQVWCWDITWLPQLVKGLFFYAYVIIDIFDRYIVGWSVHCEENEAHSRDLFEMLSYGRNIRFDYLHSDNGPPMKGSSLMAFLSHLEVKVSFSRPRTSNDNPFIESLFRTMKYNAKYPLRFKDLGHAREWMASFVNWYNTRHCHSAIGYVTPEQLRTGKADGIFMKRNEIMEQAKRENPEIWGSRKTKVWGAPETVILNPEVRP